MATLIQLHTGRIGYRSVLDEIITYGTKRSPRGLPTLDLGHTTIELRYPVDALPVGVGRGIKPAIAAVEALQLIAGESHPDLVTRIAPAFRAFQEDNGVFHGAYGHRVRRQVKQAIDKIVRDRDTRQAVIQIWDHDRDNVTPVPRDVPCTVALGLAVVDDRLNCHVTMRSNDAWLGLPYDLFQFTQLQMSVARVLGIDPGTYCHTAWSLHLYERDLDKADQVVYGDDVEPLLQSLPSGIGPAQSWDIVEDVARTLLSGVAESDYHLSWSERWYQEQLEPYVKEEE